DEASAAVQGERPQLMQVLIPRANLRTQPSPAGKRARSSKRELRPASFSRIAIGTRSGAASASGGMIGVCSMANWPDSTACRTGVSRQKARGALHGRFPVAPQNSTQPPSRGGRRLVQPRHFALLWFVRDVLVMAAVLPDALNQFAVFRAQSERRIRQNQNLKSQPGLPGVPPAPDLGQ